MVFRIVKGRKSWRKGRSWRKPYYRSRRFDATCRSHGSCPWCFGNRMAANLRKLDEWKAQLSDWKCGAL